METRTTFFLVLVLFALLWLLILRRRRAASGLAPGPVPVPRVPDCFPAFPTRTQKPANPVTVATIANGTAGQNVTNIQNAIDGNASLTIELTGGQVYLINDFLEIADFVTDRVIVFRGTGGERATLRRTADPGAQQVIMGIDNTSGEFTGTIVFENMIVDSLLNPITVGFNTFGSIQLLFYNCVLQMQNPMILLSEGVTVNVIGCEIVPSPQAEAQVLISGGDGFKTVLIEDTTYEGRSGQFSALVSVTQSNDPMTVGLRNCQQFEPDVPVWPIIVEYTAGDLVPKDSFYIYDLNAQGIDTSVLTVNESQNAANIALIALQGTNATVTSDEYGGLVNFEFSGVFAEQPSFELYLRNNEYDTNDKVVLADLVAAATNAPIELVSAVDPPAGAFVTVLDGTC